MAYARLHDVPLIVGRDENERAGNAVRELLDVGFENVSLMKAGLPGWRTCGLPVAGDKRNGVSYVSLSTPAKREKRV